jgi:hypothetical protein
MTTPRVTETRGADGWREIAIHSAQDNTLIAVITRPCSGAKWRLHRANSTTNRGTPYPTCKAAMDAALQESPA